MQKQEEETLPSGKYPTPGGVGRVLFGTSLIYLLAGTLAQWAGKDVLLKSVLLLGELMLLLPAYLHIRKHRYHTRTVLRLRAVSWRVVLMSLILGFAITLLTMELDRLVDLILPLPQYLKAGFEKIARAANWLDWLLIILAAVIAAGVFEEMLFRGFVQTAFEQRHQPLFAIFVTAILFGAVHLNPWQFVQFIFIAIFLGVMAWKSDSIIPSALVHAQNNFIVLLLHNLNEAQTSPLLNWNGHLHPVLLICALAIVALGLRFFFRFCEEDLQIPTLLNTPFSPVQR